MAQTIRRFAPALALLFACSLAACDHDPGPGTSPTPVPSSQTPSASSPPATPTPSATPSKTTNEQITDAIHKAIDGVNRANKKPGKSAIKYIDSTSRDDAELSWLRDMANLQNRGLHQTGDVTVTNISIAKPTPGPRQLPRARARVCTDLSDVDFVDSHGKSNAPHKMDSQLLILSVDHDKDGWYVADWTGGVKTC